MNSLFASDLCSNLLLKFLEASNFSPILTNPSYLSSQNTKTNAFSIDYIKPSLSYPNTSSSQQTFTNFTKQSFLQSDRNVSNVSKSYQNFVSNITKPLTIQCNNDDENESRSEDNDLRTVEAFIFSYRGERVAGFEIGVRKMICLPQVVFFFIKNELLL